MYENFMTSIMKRVMDHNLFDHANKEYASGRLKHVKFKWISAFSLY